MRQRVYITRVSWLRVAQQGMQLIYESDKISQCVGA